MAPTKKPNRLERRKLATREAILNVSRELIATDGVEHLSVNAVADQADVALGTFYNYLGDKASLFRTLAEDDCDTMRRAAGSIADGEPPATRLGWLVGVVAARACLDPVFAAYSHEMFRAGHLPHPHIQAELLWLYRRGVEAGQFTALPEPVAASVVGALPLGHNGVIARGHIDLPPTDVVAMLVGLALQTLGVEGADRFRTTEAVMAHDPLSRWPLPLIATGRR